MSYLFEQTPEEEMAALLQHLARARAGGPDADREFRRALVRLVGLYDRQAQVGAVDRQRLQAFRRESGEALMAFRDKLGAYAHRALILAEGANEGEWYELCMRRSVIQLLLDDYAGTPVASLIDGDYVADLDVEMERVGMDQGPLPESFIPKGLPESHWWWHYPEAEGAG